MQEIIILLYFNEIYLFNDFKDSRTIQGIYSVDGTSFFDYNQRIPKKNNSEFSMDKFLKVELKVLVQNEFPFSKIMCAFLSIK